jgi:hypothetical protein
VSRPPAAEIFRLASESVEVFTPPAAVVVEEARAQRGRRRRRVVAAVVAAALVVGGATWLANREPSAPADLPQARITREPNPVPVAWYADGRLHLAKVAVTVPALTDLVEINGGAAYGDHRGTVAFVAADGERRRLGRKDPDGPLVASSGEGWVAWVEPGEDGGAPTLMVYDVSVGKLLDSLDLHAPDAHPVAIDQHRVFYEDGGGTFAWAVGVRAPEPVERTDLLDVESATRVYQLAGRIEIVQSFFNVSYVRPGVGARLSAGGALVLSKAAGPGVATGRPFRPLVYDARSGHRLPSGVAADERAVDATFGREHTIVYLVTQVADLVGGSDLDGRRDPLVVLRSCDASSGECNDVTPVASGTDRPLLAR